MDEDTTFKRCKVCLQDFHRRTFAQRLKTNNHLFQTSDKVVCETCKLDNYPAPAFQNPLLTEEHLGSFALACPRTKIMCVTCNNEFCKSVFGNFLRSQTHINSLSKVFVEWRRCEVSYVDFRCKT